MSAIVPAGVRLAARRGFVRTTSQAYAATLTTGLPSAAAVVAFVQDDTPGKWVVVAITLGLAVLSPPVAGLASYLSITSKGIPEDYAAGAVQVTDDERQMILGARLTDGRDPDTGAAPTEQ